MNDSEEEEEAMLAALKNYEQVGTSAWGEGSCGGVIAAPLHQTSILPLTPQALITMPYTTLAHRAVVGRALDPTHKHGGLA